MCPGPGLATKAPPEGSVRVQSGKKQTPGFIRGSRWHAAGEGQGHGGLDSRRRGHRRSVCKAVASLPRGTAKGITWGLCGRL